MQRRLLTSSLELLGNPDAGYTFALGSGSSTELLRSLRERRFDCALVRHIPAEGSRNIVFEHLYQQRTALVFGRISDAFEDDAQAWKRPGLHWILPPAETPTRHAIDRMFIAAGLDQPIAEIECFDADAIRLLLPQRRGRMSILPEEVAAELCADDAIRSIRMDSALDLAPICFATSDRLRDDPGVTAVRDAVRRVLGRGREAGSGVDPA